MCLIYVLGSKCVLERYVSAISIYIKSIELHVIPCPGGNCIWLLRGTPLLAATAYCQEWPYCSAELAPWHSQEGYMRIPVCPHLILSNVPTFVNLMVVKWVLLLFSFALLSLLLKLDISSHTCYLFRFLLLWIIYSILLIIFFGLLIPSLHVLDSNFLLMCSIHLQVHPHSVKFE